MIAVSLLPMLPNAIPDLLTAVIAITALAVPLLWRASPFALKAGGGLGLLLGAG